MVIFSCICSTHALFQWTYVGLCLPHPKRHLWGLHSSLLFPWSVVRWHWCALDIPETLVFPLSALMYPHIVYPLHVFTLASTAKKILPSTLRSDIVLDCLISAEISSIGTKQPSMLVCDLSSRWFSLISIVGWGVWARLLHFVYHTIWSWAETVSAFFTIFKISFHVGSLALRGFVWWWYVFCCFSKWFVSCIVWVCFLGMLLHPLSAYQAFKIFSPSTHSYGVLTKAALFLFFSRLFSRIFSAFLIYFSLLLRSSLILLRPFRFFRTASSISVCQYSEFSPGVC